MTHADSAQTDPVRKPRLALMGEFSAGKSTLSNLLLGSSPLPMQITATRLPPVWISYGPDAAFAEDHEGRKTSFDLADLGQIDLAHTRVIRLYLKSETLQLCDLIDMPGISDPNMSSQVWQSVFEEADSVVWCTHATQAWRQSEAAVWDMIAPKTNGDNLLLVTQFDKLTTDRDRARVLARLRKETKDQFCAVYPISLLQAMEAGDDVDLWSACGAAKFTEHLIDLLLHPGRRQLGNGTDAAAVEAPGAVMADQIRVEPIHPAEPRITPKRVRAKGAGPRPDRPTRHDNALSQNGQGY